jgi:hypothetical protein
MPDEGAAFKGMIHGRTIELEQESGIADGREVTVIVQPSAPMNGAPRCQSPGEGIRRSSGAWSDDAEGLDRYIELVYERRRDTRRRPIEP